MVKRKEAVHCKKHVKKTPDQLSKISAALRGKKRTEEQRRKMSEARRHGGPIHRQCPNCEAWFQVEKGSEKKRFCSTQCGYIQRRGENAKGYVHDMPTIACLVCKKEMRAAARNDPRKTCSHLCKNILIRRNQKTKGTDIEWAMITAFEAIEEPYLFQYGVPRVCTADLYLPDHDTLVFCDGDYWHSLPDHIERDNRQTRILQDMGFRVVRYLGSAILADPTACALHAAHR